MTAGPRIKGNHLLLRVVAGIFITIAALAALVRLSWNSQEEENSIIIHEEKGIYDITGAEGRGRQIFLLSPGSTYYPNVYLMPEDVGSVLPEGIEEYEKIRADYLSQYFVVQVPEEDSVYTLTFKLSGRHAMKVYINGRLAGETGRLGTTKEDTVVWENYITCNGAAKDGKLHIILQSAQFYHSKRGASLAELRLAESKEVYGPLGFLQIKGLLIMGVLFSAAILLFGIYALLSHTVATLYFSLTCLVMFLRECLQSQAWVYFSIPGNRSFQLEYISLILLTIFLSLYLGQYAVNRFLRFLRYMAIIISLLYGLCVFIGDSLFYTSALGYYQVLLVLCIIPGIVGLFWNIKDPTKEQAAALYGIGVFYIAAIYDILMYSDLFGQWANRPLSEMAMVVFVLAQTVSLFLMNNRVLDEVRATEQKLENEKAVLESLNRLKTEFLSNVSHELKTPLTVVSGHAQLLRAQLSGPENTMARDKARIISSEAERLAIMVGQVLDVTRIEEGGMLLEQSPCYLDELIYQAVETHFSILNKNGNRLDLDVSLELPQVYADSSRITQVLINLIANALRHTENGVITISAKLTGEWMEVAVADTGTGMTAEEHSSLFSRFSHGKSETGTGLGLYICKYLVEGHGGTIRVDSCMGKGTTILFTLPLAAPGVDT